MDTARMRNLTAYERELIERFPKLSQEDLDAANALFPARIVYHTEKGGRRIWTSCCHREELIPFAERTETPERMEIKTARHGDKVTCPFCGRTVLVNCQGRIGVHSGSEMIPITFVHVSERGEVFLQAYWTAKDYKNRPDGYPLYDLSLAGYYRLGEARQFYITYGEYYSDFELEKVSSKKRIFEPFDTGGMGGHLPYTCIGLERLRESFARWCDYERWCALDAPHQTRHDDLFRWLLIAAMYPQQLEMLTKNSQRQLINDLIWASRKNARLFIWDEPDPRKAFKMSKTELVQYFADGRELEGLLARRVLGTDYTHAREWITGLDAMPVHRITDMKEEARARGLGLDELRKYLLRFTGARCHGGWFGLQQAFTMWTGYLVNAAAVGYDLTQRDRLLPRDLYGEHDAVSEIVRQRRQAEDDKAREQLRAAAAARETRLNAKYGFETQNFIIRAPHDADEIVAEGRALEHCVGGYAARHAAGSTTILFLRSKAEPDKPLCTIEVKENRLIQIHGFRNERTLGSVKPAQRFAEIFEPWHRWLEAGCPKNKDGTPRVPKKKEKKTA